jgi:3-oxoacyl-[acyl-carrier protein] reductase
MFDLSGQTALVSGASGGIGGAIAKALHSRGARVMLGGTRRHALSLLADELGERAHIGLADLADPVAADQLVKDAEATMGRIDILVNNAGITRDALTLRMSDDAWQIVIQVNLTATFRLTRGVLRGMVRRRHGRVIGVTSVVAFTGNTGQANYAAAKAAMTGMSKSIAAEIAGRGITVNCVAPGVIATAMSDRLPAGQQTRLLGMIPAGRFGAPEDVAAAVVFLASAEAAYVTGQTLHVNGGMAMV